MPFLVPAVEISVDDEPPSSRSGRIAVVYNADFLPGGSAADAALGLEAGEESEDIARRVAELLARRGLNPVLVAVDDDLAPLSAVLEAHDIALVVNLVESLGGDGRREPEVPKLLQATRIPYTGNSARALRNAQGKHVAHAAMRAAGVRLPDAAVCDGPADAATIAAALAFPLFVKPACEDGSVGIDQGAIVGDLEALEARLTWLAERIDGPIVVETYLPGRELNVAIFPQAGAHRAVVTGIDFSSYPSDYAPIVTYDCKWTPDCAESGAFSRPIAPEELGEPLYDEVVRQARAAFRAIGGDAYCRVDLRLDADGLPRVIDVNPNPDLHPEAGFSLAAASAGVGWDALVLSLVAEAHLRAERAERELAAGDSRTRMTSWTSRFAP